MFTRDYDGIHEEPVRLTRGSCGLHAMFYGPGRGASTSGVVLAAPDGEERSWAERSLVTTARALAQSGCAVLRFDYAGQGESDGDYEETTFQTRIADLITACAAMRLRCDRVPTVLGVRLGAAVAVAASAESADLRDLVLWEPTFAPAQYIHQVLRANVSMQMVVHGEVARDRDQLIVDARAGGLVSVNGYNLSGVFIDELLALDLSAALDRRTGRLLALVNGVVNPELAGRPGVEVERVACPPFWTEPKVHVTAAPPFLARSIAWLASSPAGCVA